ncbi:MAG: hypothetical protein K2L52_06425, partial [Clostridia bacterium]|nr:hypothetical protein [Clostridia bacterium]
MDSKTLRVKYLKFAILIISVCFLLGAISACLPIGISIPELESNAISETKVTITQNTTDLLGEFNNGYSYIYSDKDKVDGYRAGTQDYDITTHKVVSTSARGTQDNPYVIATTDDWETFVKKMEIDTTRGSGQYFVLGADLDFTGVTFHPVRFFNGTFYGMGHSIKNISCDKWQYYNNGTTLTDIASTTNGFGLFCRITGAVVTDLIVENFKYEEMPSLTLSGTTRGTFIGGIAGISSGNNTVLNCHTVGEVKSTVSYSVATPIGGIVGGIHTFGVANTKLLIYRCSSKIDISVISTGIMVGGINGDMYNGAITSNIYAYDCVANVICTTGSNNNQFVSSGFGLCYHNGSANIENFVGTLDLTTSAGNRAGALLSSCGNMVTKIKNCYVEGTLGASSASKNSMYAVIGENYVSSASNINVVKSTSTYASAGGYSDALAKYSGEPIESSSTTEMLTKAKTFLGTNYFQIWDTSKIGADYTPDNSPVRNYLMAFINFRNIINGGEDLDNDVEEVGIDDGVGYITGATLPTRDSDSSDFSDFLSYLNTKATTKHEFVGWTDDPTGESEPFTELPSGFFGDVTLYAVWTLPDDYVSSRISTSLTLKDGVGEIT